MNERQIKIIDGYERYKIDTDGKIYDTKYNNREVCQWVDNVGYYQCILKDNDNNKKYKRVHRLIAKAFIPNDNNLPFVNHKDGNKLNNKADNLEWCSNKENTQHGYDNGLYKFKTRSYPINVYLKDSGEFIAQYKSIRSMCKELKLNRKTVSNILNGTKATNNYMYLFEYVEESQTTIESIA